MKTIYDKTALKTPFYASMGKWKGVTSTLGFVDYASAAPSRNNLIQCFQNKNLAALVENIQSHVNDFLKLLEDSFARDWRRPRTWPWTSVAWAYGFALVGVTSGVGMSLLIAALSASPPARAPTALVETSEQFTVIQ